MLSGDLVNYQPHKRFIDGGHEKDMHGRPIYDDRNSNQVVLEYKHGGGFHGVDGNESWMGRHPILTAVVAVAAIAVVAEVVIHREDIKEAFQEKFNHNDNN